MAGHHYSREKPMVRLDDEGMRGPAARGRGHPRGRRTEDGGGGASVTALFIRRLNSLGGEASECQHGEDDYEEYRSSPLPPPPPPPEAPPAMDAGGGGGDAVTLVHPSAVAFCWRCICFTSAQIKLSGELQPRK